MVYFHTHSSGRWSEQWSVAGAVVGGRWSVVSSIPLSKGSISASDFPPTTDHRPPTTAFVDNGARRSVHSKTYFTDEIHPHRLGNQWACRGIRFRKIMEMTSSSQSR